MVTTVDAFHSQYIVAALERGVDVMTEKPMVIDETQCQAVLDAEKKTGRKIVVTFNYRYAPKHQKIKEMLMSARSARSRRSISPGTSTRRTAPTTSAAGTGCARRAARSGCTRPRTTSISINWWLDADPVQVSALGSLANYGKSGPFRHTNCRDLPAQGQVLVLLGHQPRARTSSTLYNDCESADGY